MALAKEQIRQIINQNDITSVTDAFCGARRTLMRFRADAAVSYDFNQIVFIVQTEQQSLQFFFLRRQS